MAGYTDMAMAVGFEHIKRVVEQHVPPIQYDFKYDTDHYIAYVFDDDSQGQGTGRTMAEALKTAYFNWWETRVAKLEQVSAAPEAADSTPETTPTPAAAAPPAAPSKPAPKAAPRRGRASGRSTSKK